MKLSTRLHKIYTLELTEDESYLLLESLVNLNTCTASKCLSHNLITELRKHLDANV